MAVKLCGACACDGWNRKESTGRPGPYDHILYISSHAFYPALSRALRPSSLSLSFGLGLLTGRPSRADVDGGRTWLTRGPKRWRWRAGPEWKRVGLRRAEAVGVRCKGARARWGLGRGHVWVPFPLGEGNVGGWGRCCGLCCDSQLARLG